MGGNTVVVEAGRQRTPGLPVVPQVFVQRHADAHDGAALDLAGGGERIDDAAAVVDGDVLHDARAAQFDVDLDLDEVGAEGIPHFAVEPRIRCRRGDERV